MGLASALSTALTGLSAAETQIDVIGNNLANSQTVGFKASDTLFASQYLRNLSMGSAPTESNGGTNPRQIGLGTRVSSIMPDFTQGTIEISSVPSDMAIQGNGFFIVRANTGEDLYTRNGIFRTNADNELVTVAGERLLGFGVDEEYRIQTTELAPLTIPLGSEALAQATENVYLEGVLTPTGDVADTAEVIESARLGIASNPTGPPADASTRLVDLVRSTPFGFEPLFAEGDLTLDPSKGGRSLGEQQFSVTSTSTVQDLMTFMDGAMGIQTAADDPTIVDSVNNIPGETGTLPPGVVIQNGQIRAVSNNGLDNALGIDSFGFQLVAADGTISTPDLGFASIQGAVGQSTYADFVAYDTLGIPVNVRITSTLESRDPTSTTYRWFAEARDNQPVAGVDTTVGTGTLAFDGQGNFVSATNSTVNIERNAIASNSPLGFDLDFSQISGLADPNASLAATRQDGFPPGRVTSYQIGEDGVVRGVFSNGVVRDLGQVRLARFTNPTGLVQRGENMYGYGVNAGLPVEGSPNADGMGSLIAGALELSNTDIGKDLIDLVLATTQYRGNTRVISTAQQLLDELMNLRR